MPRIGVLALQGDFAAHARMAVAAGAASCIEVRRAHELREIAGLILPGGESTALGILLDADGMREAIGEYLAGGGAVFGTCAGIILLAREVTPAAPPVQSFGALDVTVARNGYGRQRESCETTARIDALGEDAYPVTLIRAPRITRVGANVETLARVGDDPVLVRHARALGATFHPEISGDPRVHAYFLRDVVAA